MIPAEFGPIANHVWQSTLFAGAAALLTLALRRNQARVRYAIWLAASYKFLIPFSWLVSIGHLFEWRSAPPLVPQAIATVTNVVGTPVFLMPSASVGAMPEHSSVLPAAIWCIWACGFLIVTAGWAREWWRIRRMVKTGTRLDLGLAIPVVSVTSQLEPGVFGIFRPVLLFPEQIRERLAPEQLRAVIAHELCHVRRRDNLAAAIHMLVEALFWFHPLVWWLDARIVDERERACDEEVLQMGSEPTAYVETILAVCKLYVAAPVACVSGISGSDLKKRVVNIMANRLIEDLSSARKLQLSVLGMVVIVVPIVFGIVTAPLLHAQSSVNADSGKAADGKMSFEVVSIKPHAPDNGPRTAVGMGAADPSRWSAINVTAKNLITEAYLVRSFQVLGGPTWIDSERFDVDAKVDDATAAQLQRLSSREQNQQMDLMLRSLLIDRFKLQATRETKEEPVLALVVAKGGPKLKETSGGNTFANATMSNGLMTATMTDEPISNFAVSLSVQLQQPVLDQTGLTGKYDFTLKYVPQIGLSPDVSAADTLGPTIFDAVQDQLGLKLESTKGPVETITINDIEEPTPN